MAKIVLKKSSVTGKVPTATDIDYGELAINYADGKLYYKKSDNTIDTFVSASGTTTGVVSVDGNTGVVTSAQLLTSIKKEDGAGSGLDADLLDGQHGSYYLDWTNTTNKPLIPTKTSDLTNDSGYITSYTETDPIYTASSWYTTTNNSSNWNTAYSWGNHASAGYLLSSTASTTYQPLDGDLTSIAGLAATSGVLKKTAADTWTLSTVALGTETTGNYVASITNGSYITGANGGSAGAALTLSVDATSANTASKIVARDSSGNFSAGAITASLSGNASTATTLQNSRNINGVAFNGSADITITANTPNSHVIKFDTGTTEGTDLYTFNGSAAKAIDIKAGTNVTLTKAAGSITISANDTSVDWSEIQNKPDPTITLAGDLTGSVTLTDLTSGTLTATIAANSVALGTDTTGDYVAGLTAGTGISISGISGEGWSPTVTNTAPNVTTDISITHNASTVVVNSSDGTDGTINAATTSLAGVMSSTDKTKLDGIAAGAEVNVNADWNAVNGDALILNKPTLGTAAAANTTDFATAAQGAKADTALQPAAIGVSVQAYDADLTSWAAISPSAKQDTLVSGTNIKTINGTSLLGSGDVAVQPTLVSGTNIKTINGSSLLGSGDLSVGSSALTISDKTAAYTVVASDLGKIINCNGSFTISLTAAATLGAGFNCWVWNNGNSSLDAITIDPDGAETIDGRTTLILRRGEGTQIICDGTKWHTGGKKTMRGYAESYPENTSRPVASGASAIAIGSGATSSTTYATAIGQNSSAGGSQAVTGPGAMALGGSYASGTDSFAAAVANNTSSYGATGASCVAIGRLAMSTGEYSVAIGNSGSGESTRSAASGSIALGGGYAEGVGSFCSGGSSYASSAYSIAFGYGTRALQQYTVAIGYYSSSAIYGKYSFASGRFAGIGDAQTGTLVLRRATTDATATVLTSDNAAAAATNQVILPNNSAYAFTGTVVARQQASGGTASAAWEVKGLIRREANAASTVLVNSALTVIDNQPGWTLALSADTTNGGLAVTVTGAAATNIRWVATIQTSEVTYA